MSGEEKTEQEIQSLKRKDDSFKEIIIVKDDIIMLVLSELKRKSIDSSKVSLL